MSYYPGQEKTSRQIVYTVMFLIGIGLTVGLYFVKTRAQSAKVEVARLERLIATEQVALNILKAEIAYLESPERVSSLAKSQLGFVPIGGDQIISLADIDQHFPLITASDGGAGDE